MWGGRAHEIKNAGQDVEGRRHGEVGFTTKKTRTWVGNNKRREKTLAEQKKFSQKGCKIESNSIQKPLNLFGQKGREQNTDSGG